MKPIIQTLAGAVAFVIGIAGVILSVVILSQVRPTTETLSRELPQSLGHAVEIAQSVRQQGEATTQILNTTRERLVQLGATIEQLSEKLSERDANTPVLKALDKDFDLQLDNARQFVLSMQNSMRNLGSTLLLFDSMSIFGNRRLSGSKAETEQPENPIRTVAVGLKETADKFDQVVEAMDKLQSGESVRPGRLQNVQDTLKLMDAELVKINEEVKAFSDEVAVTESKLTGLKESSPTVVNYVSRLVSLFLVCFAGSQLMLAFFGVHIIRHARVRKSSENPA